jgi:hypothetical protein
MKKTWNLTKNPISFYGFTVPVGGWYAEYLNSHFAGSGWKCNGFYMVYGLSGIGGWKEIGWVDLELYN